MTLMPPAPSHIRSRLRFPPGGDRAAENGFRIVTGAMMAAMARKDIHLYGHSLKVAEYAAIVGNEVGLPESEIAALYYGGLLHDIGKVGLPAALLKQLGNLNREEFLLFKRHPLLGSNVLKPFRFYETIAPLVRDHHERPDGSGYPERKKKRAIPAGARIIAICDAFDAMISERPNRDPMKIAAAVAQLRTHAGTLFDHHLVDAFVAILRKTPEIAVPFTIAGMGKSEKKAEKILASPENRQIITDAGILYPREDVCGAIGRLRRNFGVLYDRNCVNAVINALLHHPDEILPFLMPENEMKEADDLEELSELTFRGQRRKLTAKGRICMDPPCGILPS